MPEPKTSNSTFTLFSNQFNSCIYSGYIICTINKTFLIKWLTTLHYLLNLCDKIVLMFYKSFVFGLFLILLYTIFLDGGRTLYLSYKSHQETLSRTMNQIPPPNSCSVTKLEHLTTRHKANRTEFFSAGVGRHIRSSPRLVRMSFSCNCIYHVTKRSEQVG